ncbi:MAG: TCR/Tet family MFS transporter [Planctomycetota bacterium]
MADTHESSNPDDSAERPEVGSDQPDAVNPYEPTPSAGEASSPGLLKRYRNRKAGIAFILVTLFIDILGIGIVIPVLPKLVETLGNTDESGAAGYYGIIAASYAMMQFIFSPVLGALSDRFGRRPILLGSLFGLGIDFIIQGLATRLEWLFIARIVSGILGASFTTGNAYIADVSNDDTRARNFGFVGVAFGLGFIIGPALGGVLGDISVKLPFFVAAGLSLVNWLYGFFVLPESLPPEKRGKLSFANANPFASIRNLRRYPLVFGLAIVFTIKALAQRGLENTWVLFGSAKFGWDLTTTGLTLLWVGITTVIVQGGLVRPVVKRFGERYVLLVSTLISSAAFLGYSLASESWMVFAIISFGALGGLAGPAVQSIVTRAVDETEQGQIQGALTQLQSLASIVSPILFTSVLLSRFTGDNAIMDFPGAPFLLGSVLIFLSFFVAIAVFRRFPEKPDERTDAQP